MTNNPTQVDPVEGLVVDEVEALADAIEEIHGPLFAEGRYGKPVYSVDAKDLARAAFRHLSPRITQQTEEVSRQQVRADQQSEWAIREAQKAVTLETEVARLREALAEQVAECFDERCEMCARHESLLNEQPGGELS